jgi:GxxExxY protein
VTADFADTRGYLKPSIQQSPSTKMLAEKLIHRHLSETIIGAAMKVLNTLKPGLDEKAYENAMVVELTNRGCRVEQQRRFDVRYEGVLVDTLVPDLIVNETVVVDPKVCETFTPTHMAQMIGYLAITELQLALILNFKFSDLRWQRVVRQTPPGGNL